MRVSASYLLQCQSQNLVHSLVLEILWHWASPLHTSMSLERGSDHCFWCFWFTGRSGQMVLLMDKNQCPKNSPILWMPNFAGTNILKALCDFWLLQKAVYQRGRSGLHYKQWAPQWTTDAHWYWGGKVGGGRRGQIGSEKGVLSAAVVHAKTYCSSQLGSSLTGPHRLAQWYCWCWFK